MKIQYIDQVIARRNYIQTLARIRQKAQSHTINLTLGDGDETAVFSHMSASVIRDAIMDECGRLTEQYEKEMREMGVEI